ncbi:hypothetical protein GC093_04635 [Paenibacillus sp. LMG 31456]|uniref:Uncharacterized protein n=1 Tax=Paenibacillus foliorum TaxID=2654974 RepID=A0A972GXU1_9BACL|nr:hypothetical protein [Paenibacillus foliorum]NOU92521.1 hypothetical protein [Paenibacillus foliorum]
MYFCSGSANLHEQKYNGFDIAKTVELLRRCAYIEHSCVRALAGWFLKVPRWERKIQLGYLLFGHAERVYELQGRLEELRGGHREANMEPALAQLGKELVHAPDEASFLRGYIWMFNSLSEFYRDYLEVADHAANALGIRYVRRYVSYIERELEELRGQGYSATKLDPHVGTWIAHLSSCLPNQEA